MRYAIGCKLSGSVGSMIGIEGGDGTLGSGSGICGGVSGTLGGDPGPFERDGGSICGTLGDGAGVPGCVEIGIEGCKSGAG